MPRRPPSSAPSWNPDDYAANAAAQHQWARELVGQLSLAPSDRILDVGCGDGAITAAIAQTVPHGHVLGIDSSPDMIRHARRKWPASRHPNLHFEVMDARELRLAEPVDVVFSNAALHWVDDHARFLQAAAAALRPDGRLAISCGGRGNAADVFRAVRSVLRDARWRAGFRGMTQPYHFYGPEAYARWLQEAGLQPHLLRLQPKTMIQPTREAFAGWIRTTWLPYTQRVPSALRETFVSAVIDRYLKHHPADPSAGIRVQMVRLEILAQRT